MTEQTYLVHYGVMGMRWGHRKDPDGLSDRKKRKLAKWESKKENPIRVVGAMERKKLVSEKALSDKKKQYDKLNAFYDKKEAKLKSMPRDTTNEFYDLDGKFNSAANAIESKYVERGMATYKKLNPSQKYSVMKEVKADKRKDLIATIGGTALLAAPVAIWLLDHK